MRAGRKGRHGRVRISGDRRARGSERDRPRRRRGSACEASQRAPPAAPAAEGALRLLARGDDRHRGARSTATARAALRTRAFGRRARWHGCARAAGRQRRRCCRRGSAVAAARATGRRRASHTRARSRTYGDGTRGAAYPHIRAAGSVARLCPLRRAAAPAARATGRRAAAQTRARSRTHGDGTRGGAYPRVRAAGSVASMICNVRVRARMWVVMSRCELEDPR